MESFSIRDAIYSDACLVFMLTGIICAVVRYMHMCRPYNKEADYFYPARKQLTFFYAATIMQFPYYVNPCDDGAWTYVRILIIVYYPVCFTLLFARYFMWQELKEWKNFVFLCLPMLILVVMLVAVLIHQNTWLERQVSWLRYVMGTVSLLLTARLVFIIKKLKQNIETYHKENYASEADFPFRFAQKVLWLPVIWIGMAWVLYLTESKDLKVFLDLLLSFWMVMFLCKVLHPQRLLRPRKVEIDIDRIEKEEQKIATANLCQGKEFKSECDNKTCDTPSYSEEVKEKVLKVILHKFKEPHLLKSDVLSEIDKGMNAPASRFIASVGYYNLINMFRLRYATLYAHAHPKAKQTEIADASGFLSDQALSRAKKNVEFINNDYVKDVKLSETDSTCN